MRGNEILDKMELIDPALIAEADSPPVHTKHRWVKWSVTAACFCLLSASALAFYRHSPNTANPPAPPNPYVSSEAGKGDEHTDPPQISWEAFACNEAVSATAYDTGYPSGCFTEDLTDAELASIEPHMSYEFVKYSGHAVFDREGTLIDVLASITTSIPDCSVLVTITKGTPRRCYDYELNGDPVISICNHTEFTVYQWKSSQEQIILEAEAVISDYGFLFSLETTPELLEQARADFQHILECFAYWEDDKPDLSAISAETIPEFVDKYLTLSEAQNDADFGTYMITADPPGFTAESIHRYIDQNNNYLSGLWHKDYAELWWCITNVTEDDEQTADDPIISIEELTLDAVYANAYKLEDAGDTSGWSMHFSVTYGDVIVNIRAKGIEPEWLYEQLMQLK